jgi:hypothetical protein
MVVVPRTQATYPEASLPKLGFLSTPVMVMGMRMAEKPTTP